MSKQAKVTHLLTETVRVLCQSSFDDWSEMKIQGLLGITLNDKEIFLIQINEIIDGCLGGGHNSQPSSKMALFPMKTSEANDSGNSTDHMAIIAQSSYRLNLRSTSKTVNQVSYTDEQKSGSTKLKLAKSTVHTKNKGKGRKAWQQQRTSKLFSRNDPQQHPEGQSNSVKHLSLVRKPLRKKKRRFLRTSKVKKSDSVVRMNVSRTAADSGDNSDEEQNLADLAGQDEYCCKVCKKTFSKLTYLATHYTTNHSENIDTGCVSMFESQETVPKSLGLVKCKNVSCTRYFKKINGMLKHHARVHKVSGVDTKPVLKRKILCKSKTCTRTFRSYPRMILHHMHDHNKSLAKEKFFLDTESQDHNFSDHSRPSKRIEIQPDRFPLSWIGEVTSKMNLETVSDHHLVDSDDLRACSSATLEICDAVCKSLPPEPMQNDQLSCIDQSDFMNIIIKKEECDIVG